MSQRESAWNFQRNQNFLFRMKYGIVEIPEKGRGLVATEDLKEDEVLFEESPICSAQMSWGVKLNYKKGFKNLFFFKFLNILR